MPVLFYPKVTAAAYDELTGVLTVDGSGFAVNEYVGTSDIQVSLTGAGSWASVDTVDSWSDAQVIGTFTALADGTYDVRVISSDGETSEILTEAFTFGVTGGPFFFFSARNRK